jgi:sugar O-acyltransferase (sialic acid O-acetyltransferase NeuD family)
VRPLLLVGAGGFGREAAEAVQAINSVTPRWKLLGFLDDDEALQGKDLDGTRVVGTAADIHRFPDAEVVVCAGSPAHYGARKQLVSRLRLPVARYPTLVHPFASVASSARLGPGTVLLAGAVVTGRAVVGAHVAVMPGVVITHDATVGDYVTFASGVRLGGGVEVEEGAYLGSGALIREHLKVGTWSLVGMGSVVLEDVPPYEVWVGQPAHRLRSSIVLPEQISEGAAARRGSYERSLET